MMSGKMVPGAQGHLSFTMQNEAMARTSGIFEIAEEHADSNSSLKGCTPPPFAGSRCSDRVMNRNGPQGRARQKHTECPRNAHCEDRY